MLLATIEIVETREDNSLGACYECLTGGRQGLDNRLANGKWTGASVPLLFPERRVFQLFEGFQGFFKRPARDSPASPTLEISGPCTNRDAGICRRASAQDLPSPELDWMTKKSH